MLTIEKIIEKDISALRAAESTPINEEPKKIFKKAKTDDMTVVEFIIALKVEKMGRMYLILVNSIYT